MALDRSAGIWHHMSRLDRFLVQTITIIIAPWILYDRMRAWRKHDSSSK